MRMCLAIAFLPFLLTSPAAAQPGSPADETAIRGQLAAYADARGRRDAAAEARLYSEDGDFRSSAGPFVSGRAAVERQLTVGNPAYRFGLTVTKLRFLTPDIAVADADVLAGLEGRQGRLVATYVMRRESGRWMIAAARIATAPPPRAPGSGAAPARIPGVTGVWRGEVTLPNGTVLPFIARLTQSGSQVTGRLDGIGGAPDVTIADGKVEGDTVTFSGVRKINDADVKFNYSAKFVDDNTLDFTIVREDGQQAPLKSLAKRER
jgi:uncharacterized protein (TIGR02246 family)